MILQYANITRKPYSNGVAGTPDFKKINSDNESGEP